MTKLLVINPNTTASMTRKVEDTAQAVASPGTRIVAVNPADGPASIEGYFDEALSVPGIFREMRAHGDADAVVIACFDDTGLDAVRCMTDVPVLGIGEAGFHAASIIACKFGVVTTLGRSVPAIEHNLARYGLASRCSGVRASEVPVLELEREGGDARRSISREIERARDQDGAEAIVLGCAGMTDLAASLAEEHGMPVLDGVACAIAMAEALHRIGCRTSKLRGYDWPTKEAWRPGRAGGT